jgi:hypothetical protein
MAASDMLIEIYMAESIIEQRNWQRIKERGSTGANSNGKIILVSSSRYRYSKGRKRYFFWKVMNNE